MSKILVWDLETSNLNADFGYILCGGVKEYKRSGVEVLSIAADQSYKSDPTSDKMLVKRLAARLAEADVWITWYGSRFDVPFLNTRLLHHKQRPLPRIPHIDLWWTARHRLALHSNRLKSVAQFLGLPDKTEIRGPVWQRAAAGHEPSLKYIIKHCERDVVVLEKAYNRMQSLVVGHPNLNLIDDTPDRCPRCHHPRLQKRGLGYTACGTRQRYQCQGCGGWASGSVRLKKNVLTPA